MQSWGTQSRFGMRDTGLEPSKSGIVGLLCAALGRPRAQPVADLVALRLAARVDREGAMAADFHTAKDVIRSDGSGCANTVISSRYYLADADFLVGLEGEQKLLEQLDAALRRPVWPLYFGRKSFVPGLPIAWPSASEAILDWNLRALMEQTPWPRRNSYEKRPERLRCVSDIPFSDFRSSEPRQDVPVSFEQRTFTIRRVWNGFITFTDPNIKEHADVSKPIDP
jgi:CRISPR system Cascade subunit CasD